eukprot:161451-Pyramimonas_sp.AAC.1
MTKGPREVATRHGAIPEDIPAHDALVGDRQGARQTSSPDALHTPCSSDHQHMWDLSISSADASSEAAATPSIDGPTAAEVAAALRTDASTAKNLSCHSSSNSLPSDPSTSLQSSPMSSETLARDSRSDWNLSAQGFAVGRT